MTRQNETQILRVLGGPEDGVETSVGSGTEFLDPHGHGRSHEYEIRQLRVGRETVRVLVSRHMTDDEAKRIFGLHERDSKPNE